MKMLLTDEEFHVLTMFRALTPDKQEEVLPACTESRRYGNLPPLLRALECV